MSGDKLELLESVLNYGDNEIINFVYSKFNNEITKDLLFYAARMNKTNVVKFLLDKKYTINELNESKETLLQYNLSLSQPIQGEHDSIIELLIKDGIDINNVDKFGETAIFDVCRHKSSWLFDFFIKNGAKIDFVNKNGLTLLHIATSHNRLDITEKLLKLGANLNAKNQIGYSPIDCAKTEEMKKLYEFYIIKEKAEKYDALMKSLAELNIK